MLVRIHAAALLGIQPALIILEVDSSPGLPGFSMVGLPDSAVRESRERVVSALRNGGFEPMRQRVTVNFAPADMRKEGSSFDLALAVGMLAASGQIPPPGPENIFLGELGLDGSLLPVRGALCVSAGLPSLGGRRLFVPVANAAEASAGKAEVVPVEHLAQCAAILRGDGAPSSWLPSAAPALPVNRGPDFSLVRGQESLKRALLVAAAGFHNFLLIGSPGSGKTLAARCFAGILGPLSNQEALETTMIHSSAGLLAPGFGLLEERPFRSPHHSASLAALVGGGSPARPGEVSLAHGGVLFLDELPEFQRSALESLRQPLEEGRVFLCRARGYREYPARFLLGAAMNPCPCGYFMDPLRACRCQPPQVAAYCSRVSGPLLDRIDIQVEVSTPAPECWGDAAPGRDSASLAAQVQDAREFREARGQQYPNACLAPGCAEEVCNMNGTARRFLEQAYRKVGLSARGRERTLRVARTLADLEGVNTVGVSHLAEALQYRLSSAP